MIAQHIFPLATLAPLALAALAALTPGTAWARAIARTGVSLAFACALASMVWALSAPPTDIYFGGWAPPLGIAWRLDAATGLMMTVIAGAGFFAFPWARSVIARELPQGGEKWGHICWLLALAGLLGVVSTNDAFNLFVFLEIASIASYALVAMGGARDKRALIAAYDYVIMGTLGAAFFVIGLGFLFITTGALNMGDLARLTPPLGSNRAVDAGFIFIVVGLGLKMALFPLHAWLAPAYAKAPSHVAAFLAAAASKAAIYAFARMTFSVLGEDFSTDSQLFETMIGPLAALGALWGSFAAARQQTLRRVFAWSSIAQVGLIMLAFAVETRAGLAAGLALLCAHALVKACVFTSLGAHGDLTMARARGLARRDPLAGVLITLACLSLAGVPGFAGFVAKFSIMRASLVADHLVIFVVAIVASLLTLVYVARILETIWSTPPDSAPAPALAPAPRLRSTEALAPALLAAAGLALGLFPSGWIRLTQAAAEALFATAGGGA